MTAVAPPPEAITPWTTARLRPHPFNAEIYGDDGGLDADLRASIRTMGVLEPLEVLPDGRIISGHRRWAAALAEGVLTVPTRRYPGDPHDDTEIKAAILEHNRQRDKTPEQRAREVKAMLDIEQERGLRKKAHGQTAPGRTLTASDAVSVRGNGRAATSSAIVGDLLGMSARQVEMAASLVKSIDELAADGDYAGAEQVRQTLNQAGIGPAYKEVRKARGERAGPIRPPDAGVAPRESRNAIPHDPVRAAAVIRKNFTRDFAAGLLVELQKLLREDWS